VPSAADDNRMSLTLLIVDDHPLIRVGLRALLEHALDQPQIFEATDGREALEIAAREQPASRSGSSTRLSGDRIAAVSAMKCTPAKMMTLAGVCAAWRERPRESPT